jgi:hypothetical protein
MAQAPAERLLELSAAAAALGMHALEEAAAGAVSRRVNNGGGGGAVQWLAALDASATALPSWPTQQLEGGLEQEEEDDTLSSSSTNPPFAGVRASALARAAHAFPAAATATAAAGEMEVEVGFAREHAMNEQSGETAEGHTRGYTTGKQSEEEVGRYTRGYTHTTGIQSDEEMEEDERRESATADERQDAVDSDSDAGSLYLGGLAARSMQALLGSDGLRCPMETDVLAAVLDWAAARRGFASDQKLGRQEREDVTRLLEAVRWVLIPPETRRMIAHVAAGTETFSVPLPAALHSILNIPHRRVVLREVRDVVVALATSQVGGEEGGSIGTGTATSTKRRVSWGWDAARAGLRTTLTGHSGDIVALASVPGASSGRSGLDGWAVSGSRDGTVQFWDLEPTTKSTKEPRKRQAARSGALDGKGGEAVGLRGGEGNVGVVGKGGRGGKGGAHTGIHYGQIVRGESEGVHTGVHTHHRQAVRGRGGAEGEREVTMP